MLPPRAVPVNHGMPAPHQVVGRPFDTLGRCSRCDIRQIWAICDIVDEAERYPGKRRAGAAIDLGQRVIDRMLAGELVQLRARAVFLVELDRDDVRMGGDETRNHRHLDDAGAVPRGQYFTITHSPASVM